MYSAAAKSWPTCPPQSLLSSEGELVPRRPARASHTVAFEGAPDRRRQEEEGGKISWFQR